MSFTHITFVRKPQWPNITWLLSLQSVLFDQQTIGPHEDLLTTVKRRKLKWYGHVSRSSGLAKTILQGTVKGGKKTGQTVEEKGRRHQGMDRPGVRQVPKGSGERGKMEETEVVK